MEYARARGSWWARKHPNLADDILATAFLALVKALTAKSDGINMKGFISRCIDNEVTSLLRENDIIKIPKSEIQRRKAADLGYDDLPKARMVEDIETLQRERSRQPPTWVTMHVDDVYRLLELSEYEEEILRAKVHGYSLSEIGDRLCKAKSTLSETLSNIRGRYERLMRTHPELLRPNDKT